MKLTIRNHKRRFALCASFTFLTAAFICGLSSCASSGLLTDSLAVAGSVASLTGHDKTASALSAGSSISKALEDITPENEYYIGRSVAATLLTNYGTYDNATIESYLNKICQVLVINSDTPEIFNGYHVKLLDSSEVNAFSTSGGHILVTRGLIACAKSEDALAAVIAHEIAHIQLKHSLKAIKTSRYTEALKSSTNAAMTAAGKKKLADNLDGMVGDVVTSMVNNGYSQSQEFEADNLALTLMANSGYTPEAMKEMLTLMKSHQGSSKSGFYKTHPSPDKRISNVDKSIGKYSVVNTRSLRTNRYNTAMN